jgi:hypothetical protein
MKLWEQGKTSRERVELRVAEDAERARLSALDKAHPRKGPSRLLEWTLAIRPGHGQVGPTASSGRPPRRRGG